MSVFQIDNDFITRLKSLIAEGKTARIQQLLHDVHYADLAEIFTLLSSQESTHLIKILDSNKTADALAEIDEDLRETLLQNLSAEEIAEEIQELDTDDAADLIAELPDALQEDVISAIEDDTYVEDLRELLTYDDNSAGGLMAKELVKVQEDLSVLKCINTIRKQAQDVTRVHSIYVVDKKNCLKGRLSLKDLITANNKAIVNDIYIPKVDYVTVDTPGEEVAKVMSKI